MSVKIVTFALSMLQYHLPAFFLDHYKIWLAQNPTELDDMIVSKKATQKSAALPSTSRGRRRKPSEKKEAEKEALLKMEHEWHLFLEKQTEEEREERRRKARVHFVERLPAPLADKATNMYRQGSRGNSRQRYRCAIHVLKEFLFSYRSMLFLLTFNVLKCSSFMRYSSSDEHTSASSNDDPDDDLLEEDSQALATQLLPASGTENPGMRSDDNN